MTKAYRLLAPALLATAASAGAAETNLSASTAYTDYSKAFGSRREMTAESTSDFGRTAFTISLSQGTRKFESESATSIRAAGTVYHDWSEKFFTRTTVGISSNKPVFATREVANDFNYKVLPNTVATVGAKHARYYGGTDVLSWSAGASWYFRSGIVNYRFSSFDIDKMGKSHGHLASVRLKDGKGAGYTQLWAGSGTSLHDQDILGIGKKGNYRSLAVQRIQPVAGPVAVNLTLGRSWYKTPSGDYHGTTASVGLSVKGLPKL